MPTPFDQLPVLASDRAQLIDPKRVPLMENIPNKFFGPDPWRSGPFVLQAQLGATCNLASMPCLKLPVRRFAAYLLKHKC